MKTTTGSAIFSQIKVSNYPDGGISRLHLFDETLPESVKGDYRPIADAKSVRFEDVIPQTIRSLAPRYDASDANINTNWAKLEPGAEVDVASSAYGGKIVKATNEHYGPAVQVISPYPPLHMFDGMESARSRAPGHFEEVIIGLGKPSRLNRLELDFTYFVNNNPLELSIHGLTGDKWIPLVEKMNVKGYAANKIVFEVTEKSILSQLKVTAHPDGGINRVKAFTVL
ncbi:allantoicase [compost metagenome]